MSEAEETPTCSLRLEATRKGLVIWPDGGLAPALDWFDPEALAASGQARAGGVGRGATVRFHSAGRECVLRHYRRGGLASRVTEDRYLRTGLRNSRPWRELALLVRLHAGGMPVPPPLAARVQPLGPLSPWYRGDLVTEWLPDTRTLAQALGEGPLDEAVWAAIGRTLRRFHSVGVDHADLNAHNILLGADGAVYVIDFDRARLRRPGRWQQGNLERLRRSLDKLRDQGGGGFAFGEDDWRRLRAGYDGP